MRLLMFAVVLAVVISIPFLIWGEAFQAWATGGNFVAWLREAGPWGAAAIFLLLAADLFLPVPATPLISLAGYLYGPLLGGLIGAGGSFTGGLVGYALCRALGRATTIRLLGPAAVEAHTQQVRTHGPWLVAGSRWLPVLPEVVACLAGLLRMPLGTFILALACGSLPFGFTFALLGTAGKEHPGWALVLSLVLPLLLWLATRKLLQTSENAT